MAGSAVVFILLSADQSSEVRRSGHLVALQVPGAVLLLLLLLVLVVMRPGV